jgi:hypothetical protein
VLHLQLREERHQRVGAHFHDGRQVELDQRVALLGRERGATARSCSLGRIAFNLDSPGTLADLCGVVGRLHPQEVADVRAECLVNPQRHFCSQGCLAVYEIELQ